MAFKTGRSGNPNGRPKMTAEEKKLLAEFAKKSLKTIGELAESAKNEKVKLSASIWIAERQWGKAVQLIANEDEDRPLLIKWAE